MQHTRATKTGLRQGYHRAQIISSSCCIINNYLIILLFMILQSVPLTLSGPTVIHTAITTVNQQLRAAKAGMRQRTTAMKKEDIWLLYMMMMNRDISITW